MRELPVVQLVGLLLGHSTGGLAALAVAERNPSGIVGVLNFDGGYHASAQAGEACGPDRLVDTMAALGGTAGVPALWLYAENDPLYGPDLARQLLAAYTANGARARLQILPPLQRTAMTSSSGPRQALGSLPSNLSLQSWGCRPQS